MRSNCKHMSCVFNYDMKTRQLTYFHRMDLISEPNFECVGPLPSLSDTQTNAQMSRRS